MLLHLLKSDVTYLRISLQSSCTELHITPYRIIDVEKDVDEHITTYYSPKISLANALVGNRSNNPACCMWRNKHPARNNAGNDPSAYDSAHNSSPTYLAADNGSSDADCSGKNRRGK